MTGCVCYEGGWCDRHGVKKSDRMHELCQTRQNYWEAWEQGIGPGQKSRGLGDTVAKVIRTATAGLVTPCGGCVKRKEKLNALMPYRTEELYPSISKRNLIYHVYPAKGYEGLIHEIANYRHIFNGKVVVAIACDDSYLGEKAMDTVSDILQPDVIDLFQNDRVVRETATFAWLMREVLNSDPNTTTFYCHTKANSTADDRKGAEAWRKVMVKRLLGSYADAMEHLKRYSFVGTHKMIWPDDALPPYPTRLRARHQWMHAGTFWWFRHDRVSEVYVPTLLKWDRYGVEALPSQMFPHEEAYSMWQPWGETEQAYPQRSPYDPRLYEKDYSK